MATMNIISETYTESAKQPQLQYQRPQERAQSDERMALGHSGKKKTKGGGGKKTTTMTNNRSEALKRYRVPCRARPLFHMHRVHKRESNELEQILLIFN